MDDQPQLADVLGVRGTGVVETVGDGVSGFHPGDWIADAGLPVGGHVSERLLPAGRAVPLSDDVRTGTPIWSSRCGR